MESHKRQSQAAGKGARLGRDVTRPVQGARWGENPIGRRLEAAGCGASTSGLHMGALVERSGNDAIMSFNSSPFGSLNIFGAHCRAPTPERAPQRDLDEDMAEKLEEEIEEISQQREKLEREVETLKANWSRRLKVIRGKLAEKCEKAMHEEKLLDPRGPKSADAPRIPFEGTVPRYATHAATAWGLLPNEETMPSSITDSAMSTTTATEKAVAHFITTIIQPRDADVAAVSTTPEGAIVTAEVTQKENSKKSGWADWRKGHQDHLTPINMLREAAAKRTADIKGHKGPASEKRSVFIAQPSANLMKTACRKVREKKRERVKLKVSIPIRITDQDKENVYIQPVPIEERSQPPHRSVSWWL